MISPPPNFDISIDETMSIKFSELKQSLGSLFAFIVLPLAAVTAYFIFYKVLGSSTNFEASNPENQPLEGNYLGTIYKGGPIVILLIAYQITLLAYTIERFITLILAKGKSNNRKFILNIKELFKKEDYDAITKACDQQQGSLANVVKNGLNAYNAALSREDLSNEKKSDLVEKEIEEAAHLEIPILNSNMIVISTLASISTLTGLLGTVTGMIVAFASLARVGAPDAVGLASGISQALVTTALGISTAAIAIVVYNYFTNQIDHVTYAIDEAKFSIVQNFKQNLRQTESESAA